MSTPKGPRPCSRPLPSADFNLHPKQLCQLQREVAHSHTPPRAWGLSGQDSAHRNHAQSRHCSAPAALFLVRVGPEHLRAGSGLTHTPGQVSDPGLHSTRPSSLRSPRGFHCTQALGPCLHPPDSWVRLLRRSS